MSENINWQDNYNSFAEFLMDEGDELERQISDQDRWSTTFDVVYEYQGKFYKFWFSRGSTEMQDGMDWDYGEPVEVIKTFKMIETVVWEPVK